MRRGATVARRWRRSCIPPQLKLSNPSCREQPSSSEKWSAAPTTLSLQHLYSCQHFGRETCFNNSAAWWFHLSSRLNCRLRWPLTLSFSSPTPPPLQGSDAAAHAQHALAEGVSVAAIKAKQATTAAAHTARLGSSSVAAYPSLTCPAAAAVVKEPTTSQSADPIGRSLPPPPPRTHSCRWRTRSPGPPTR